MVLTVPALVSLWLDERRIKDSYEVAVGYRRVDAGALHRQDLVTYQAPGVSRIGTEGFVIRKVVAAIRIPVLAHDHPVPQLSGRLRRTVRVGPVHVDDVPGIGVESVKVI